ncbi:hypothetical protein [Silvimonas sp.]|uniref:hypothetical protein n=1 Tax=Silvimonas sp. TaxID=2650811 RepID=UPI002844E68E|nr:hypothetical protein [Silvimonas sp.]MDR3427775.1 hypothetical protein [Silvimonas sp.]
MSITSNCMIVNLSLGMWSGYRLDKAASREVTTNAGAAADAARVNKHLVDKKHLQPIVTAASQVRQHFYEKTLPWKDNGDRVLTRMLYVPFIEEHGKLVREFRNAVNHFIGTDYPQAISQAEFRMGTLFNSDDYPSADDLRHRFYVALDIDAVSEANDFRVALDSDQVDEIRENMETAMKQRLGNAMREVWTRLADTLGHFAEKMGDEKAIFRDSTVANLLELIDILPGLNVIDDENLTAIHANLHHIFTGYEPKELRKFPEIRKNAASEAQRILDEMQGFMSAFGQAA